MKAGSESLSETESRRNHSVGSVMSDHRLEVRRRSRRTIVSSMLFLLMFLSASTWLGCGEFPPLYEPSPLPADPAQCNNGIVVPLPLENRELVKDCGTLLQIRDGLAQWQRLDWHATRSIFEWEGLAIGQAGSQPRVESLELTYDLLRGELSAEMGNLSGLVELDLTEIELHGEIPSDLSKLSNLEELNLYDNRLTGTVPPGLGRLTKLRVLILSRNSLTGKIPAELSNLSSLQELQFASNELTGEIPSGLSRLSSLRILNVSGNQLTGKIPLELPLSPIWRSCASISTN